MDGIYGNETKNAVSAFQEYVGLPADGVVGKGTWNKLFEAYIGIIDTIPLTYFGSEAALYPGRVLTQGSSGEAVTILQRYLNTVAEVYPAIKKVTPTGYFGTETMQAVIAFQRSFGIPPSGTVALSTWNRLTSVYDDVISEDSNQAGQFAGVELSEGMRDNRRG